MLIKDAPHRGVLFVFLGEARKDMKKFIPFLFAMCTLVTFLSCASTKISADETSPVAIISIVGNQNVPWIEENPAQPQDTNSEPEAEGIMTGFVNKVLYSKDPELLTAVDRLDYAFDSAGQILPEMTGFTVLEKDKVLKSETYRNLRPSYFNTLAATENASGFKDLTTIGAKNARILMSECGAKSILILSFTFQKKLLKGTRSNGQLVGEATMKAKLLDSRGREVINKVFRTNTTEKIKISGDQYDKDILIQSLNGCTDDLMRSFCIHLISLGE